MRVLAIANQKGGVGKTTTAINLGTALAAAGKGVLIFDTDPQGNASTGLDIHPHDRNVTSYDVLVGQLPLAKAVLPTKVPNLYITPGDARLSGVEGELMGEAQPQFFLRNAIEKFRAESTLGVDYMLIDCPPSLERSDGECAHCRRWRAGAAADGILRARRSRATGRDHQRGEGEPQRGARNPRRRAHHVRQAHHALASRWRKR